MALICSYCGSECNKRDEANGRCGSCACFFSGNEEVVPDAVETTEDGAENQSVPSAFSPPPAADDKSDNKPTDSGSDNPPVQNPPVQFDPTAVAPTQQPPELASSEGLIQPRRLSPQFRRRVEKTWESTFAGGHTAESTLSSQTPSSETKSESPTLSIAMRKISKAKAGQAKGASDGDYELNDVIGEGSMGRVWSAKQTSLDRDVAVKVPMAELTGAGSVGESQFISEVVVTGQLEHPNIVPIYELGRDASGVPFYSMKHVKGRPWNQFIDDQTDQENLEILMKVCDAIAFAHDRNFLHRDIKPHNVMVGEFGEVSVMDWGIAVSITKDPDQPWASVATGPAGTPAYMAPEMAAHNPSELGVVSDIYLLGAVLYEIVTGTPPHPRTGDTGDALLSAAANEIIPTTRTGELIDIARRAMATNLDDRYQSVQELQDAIRDYQSHSESIKLSESADRHLADAVERQSSDEFARARFAYEEALKLWDGNTAAERGMRAATIAHAQNSLDQEDYELGISILDAENPEDQQLLSKLEAARIWRRRMAKFTKVAVVTAITAVLTVVGVISFFWSESEKLRVKAVASETEAKDAMVRAVHAKNAASLSEESARKSENDARKQKRIADLEKRRAKEAPYPSIIGLAAESIRRKLRDKAEANLDLLDPKKRGSDEVLSKLSHIEWGLLKHAWAPSAMTDLSDGRSIESVGSSINGELIAAGTEDGNVLLWKRGLDDNIVAAPTEGAFEKINAVAVSDNGRYVAAAGVWRRNANAENKTLNHDVIVWEVDGVVTKEVSRLRGHEGEVYSVDFSSDSKLLVTSAADRTARVWDRSSEQELSVMADHLNLKVWDARFKPNSAAFPTPCEDIVTACEDGRVRVWQIAEGGKILEKVKKRHDFRGHEGPVYSAVFSPDGQSVISGGYDKRLLRWRVKSRQAIATIIDDPQTQRLIDLKKRIAGAEIDEDRIALETPVEIGLLSDRHTGSIRSISVGQLAGKTLVVSGGNDNTVRVWKPTDESWKLAKVLGGHGRWVQSCVFSDDAMTVVSGARDGLKRWEWQDYSMPRDLVSESEVRLSKQPNERGSSSALKSIYSKDGRWVATAYANGTVEVWDMRSPDRATGKMLIKGHAMLAATGILDNEGKRLLTSAGDNTTRIWDVVRGTHAQELTGTGYRGTAGVSWRPEGETTLVVTGSDDRMIPARLWRVKDGEDPFYTPLLTNHAESRLAEAIDRRESRRSVTQDSTSALSASDDLDLVNKMQRQVPDVTTVMFSQSGSRFIIGDSDGYCFVYEVESPDQEPLQLLSFQAHQSAISAAVFVQSEQSVVTADVNGEMVKWSLTDGAKESRLPWSGPVTSLDATSDGDRLLIGHAPRQGANFPVAEVVRLDGNEVASVAVLELENELGKRDWTNARPTVRSVRFTGKENQALVSLLFPRQSASNQNDAPQQNRTSGYRVGYWTWNGDAADFAAIQSAKLGDVSSAVLVEQNEQESRLLIVGGKGARLLEAVDAQRVNFAQLKKSFRPASKILTADFSYDPNIGMSNRLVVGDSEGSVRVWELDGDQWSETSGAAIHMPGKHNQAIVSTSFDPLNPDRMITADESGSWKIWSYSDQWHETNVPSGPEDSVENLNTAIFSPDGESVLVGTDENALVWSIDGQGRRKRILQNWKTGKIHSAIFSDDGSWIITSNGDQVVKIWDRNGNELASMSEGDARGTTEIAMTYDRRRLFTAQGKDIGIWDTSPVLDSIRAKEDSLEDSMEPENRKLVSELFILNKKLFRIDSDSEVNDESDVTSISISPNGRNLLSSGMNGQTTIWEGESIAPIAISFANDQFSIARNAPLKHIGESAFVTDPSRLADFSEATLVASVQGDTLVGDELAILPTTDLVGAKIVTNTKNGQTTFYRLSHESANPKTIGVLQRTDDQSQLRIKFVKGTDVRDVQALLRTLVYGATTTEDSKDGAEPSTKTDLDAKLAEQSAAVDMSVNHRTVHIEITGIVYDAPVTTGTTNGENERHAYPSTISQEITVEVEPKQTDDGSDRAPGNPQETLDVASVGTRQF